VSPVSEANALEAIPFTRVMPLASSGGQQPVIGSLQKLMGGAEHPTRVSKRASPSTSRLLLSTFFGVFEKFLDHLFDPTAAALHGRAEDRRMLNHQISSSRLRNRLSAVSA
jgi:hypothetical protein